MGDSRVTDEAVEAAAKSMNLMSLDHARQKARGALGAALDVCPVLGLSEDELAGLLAARRLAESHGLSVPDASDASWEKLETTLAVLQDD